MKSLLRPPAYFLTLALGQISCYNQYINNRTHSSYHNLLCVLLLLHINDLLFSLPNRSVEK